MTNENNINYRDFKGVWIPREIWEILKNTSLLERLVNFYFFKLPLSTGDWKELEKLNISYKSEWAPTEIVEYLRRKTPQNHASERDLPICTWCLSPTFRLHHHHYPILKSNGGKETVPICPNCHDEYHYLLESSYSLNDWVKHSFNEGKNSNE